MKVEDLKKSQTLRMEAALVEMMEEAIEFCGNYTFKKTGDGCYEFSIAVSEFNVVDGLKVYDKFNKIGNLTSMRLVPADKHKMMLSLTLSEEILLSLINKA